MCASKGFSFHLSGSYIDRTRQNAPSTRVFVEDVTQDWAKLYYKNFENLYFTFSGTFARMGTAY